MKPKNKLAVTGFILGIFHLPVLLFCVWMNTSFDFTVFSLSLLGILTVGFSGVGLYQIKKTGERGEILAIIGLTIGGFFLLVTEVGWQMHLIQ